MEFMSGWGSLRTYCYRKSSRASVEKCHEPSSKSYPGWYSNGKAFALFERYTRLILLTSCFPMRIIPISGPRVSKMDHPQGNDERPPSSSAPSSLI